MLKRQLRKRFGELPAWVDAKLSSASSDDLESWAEAILNAKTLEAVFLAENDC